MLSTRRLAITLLALTSACTTLPESAAIDRDSAEVRSGRSKGAKNQKTESRDADEPNPDGDASTTRPPCDPVETERIKQAVESGAPADVNAAVVVRTRCGPRFFSAGPDGVGPKTVHRIASISKTYTGALMLK